MTSEFEFSDFDDGVLESVLMQYDTEEVAKVVLVNEFKSIKYRRLLVESICSDAAKKTLSSRILELASLKDGVNEYFTVELSGAWVSTEVKAGLVVHVSADELTSETRHLQINDDRGIIILYPDTLISSTQVADSFACRRRSILATRIKGPGEPNIHLLQGSMMHEIFQAGLLADDFSEEFLERTIRGLVLQNLESIYCIGETEEAIATHLKEAGRNYRNFKDTYLGDAPQSKASVTVHRSFDRVPQTQCVSKVLDIEENIWSPMFGIKGKIDVSAQARHMQSNGMVTKVMPLELKTGKSTENVSHRAQTSLYTLMMTDRYEMKVDTGLLYYCKTGDLIRIPAIRDEIIGLLMSRNEMATFIVERGVLPPVLQSIHSCRQCYMLEVCMTYHKTMECGTSDSAGLGALFDSKTDFITDIHIKFLRHWHELIEFEESSSRNLQSDIWTKTCESRASDGQCFGGMIVVEKLESSDGASRICTHQYKLKRSQDTDSDYFLKSCMCVGDSIVVSSESGHIALAAGFLMQIEADHVVIGTDRTLDAFPARLQDFNADRNQNHSGLVEFSNRPRPGRHQERTARKLDHVLYRLDKNDWLSGMSSARFNVLNLFLASGDCKSRSLVVDLRPPVFVANWRAQLKMEECAKFDLFMALFNSLNINSDQRAALEQVFSARDYSLILGMPGTGKTTTIAALVAMLAILGKSVLLTSYTHSAVDNILIKVAEMNVAFLRLGNIDRVHPQVQQYTLAGSGAAESVSKLHEFLSKTKVIGTTCLGVGHQLLSQRTFDYCIVDEASQLTMPICLGPLRCASIFILVGDHNQLPPVVQNVKAREGGYDVSLFKMLSDAHPESVSRLTMQYRMNDDIMRLSNGLFYNNQLQCGDQNVAERTLKVDQSGTRNWMKPLVDGSQSVVFYDTDAVDGKESRSGDRYQNSMEAKIIQQCVDHLVDNGLSASEIGVISQYRSQLHLLAKHLQSHPDIEVLTVDRFQGRDKQCIFISFVRSNENGQIGELLQDWRRLNVALTRAKVKMVLVGSVKTLGSQAMYKKMLYLIHSKNGLYQMTVSDMLDYANECEMLTHVSHAIKKQRLLTVDKENVEVILK